MLHIAIYFKTYSPPLAHFTMYQPSCFHVPLLLLSISLHVPVLLFSCTSSPVFNFSSCTNSPVFMYQLSCFVKKKLLFYSFFHSLNIKYLVNIKYPLLNNKYPLHCSIHISAFTLLHNLLVPFGNNPS